MVQVIIERTKGLGFSGRDRLKVNTGRIDHIYKDPREPGTRLFLHYGDLFDSGQLKNLVYNIQPDAICHLAAQVIFV
jgi:GDP-D-mannose dehydratase